MFDPASVRIRGPLLAHAQGFWAELRRQGYAAESAGNQLRLAAHLGLWLQAKGLTLADLREDVVAEFLRSRRRRGYTHYFARRAVAPLLNHLRQAGVIPMPTPIVDNSAAGRLTREYAAYLRQERGLVASTIRGYADFAARFVRSERPRLDWGRLTATEVTSFVLRSTRESRSIGTSKLTVTHLRSLLRFLHVRGAIDLDLSAACRRRPGGVSPVSRGARADQVDRLLSVFDWLGGRPPRRGGRASTASARAARRRGGRARSRRRRLAGRRVLGARQRADESRLPLPRTWAERLPRTSVTAGPARASGASSCGAAPHTGMRPGASSTSFRQPSGALAHGGRAPAPHTAATQLLRRGASLPEIAHVLRHRHIDTTAIYAKVDLASLRRSRSRGRR